MTREEAIIFGKRAIYFGLDDTTREFCEIAVKALEQEPCIKAHNPAETDTWSLKDIADALKRNGIITEIQEPCEDAISRKAVLEGIENLKKIHFDRVVVLSKVSNMVSDLPSVQPKHPECDDAVSRKELLDLATTVETDDYSDNEILDVVLVDDIKQLSSVYPKQRTGHWIAIDDEPHEDYECDKCAFVVSAWTANIEPEEVYKYCPNCGAKMQDVEE